MTDTSAWFAGPRGENGDWFAGCLGKILQDYYAWRRNYFPEDGLVVDAEGRRAGVAFQDRFDDRLLELLAKLKADFPFHSPRYAAHMVSEQTMPAIAGYLAAMLYNPNNVTSEAAPVTVRLELEASQMIARMVGYDDQSWAHLTSGGTLANIEALWMARTVKYLPLVVEDMRRRLGLAADAPPFGCRPDEALKSFAAVFDEAPTSVVIRAYTESEHNVVERGFANVLARLGSFPVILAAETQHYSIKKALDVLGLGRRSLVTVRVDQEFRMDIDDLHEQLERIERRGDHVIAVIPIIGTTEEGAIDPLDKIVRLREEQVSSFWIHADAAYGGYLKTVTIPTRNGLGEPVATVLVDGKPSDVALKLPTGSSCDALEVLGKCDSVTIDPHKLGYVPYPAGAVCFKSNIVKPLARQDAPYIEDCAGDVKTERGSDSVGVYILEGSKPGAAAASVWLSHTLIPLDMSGHGILMQESIRNACELHALLEKFPTLVSREHVRAVPLCAPGSNILCFAFRADRPTPLKQLNAFNKAIYGRFNLSDKSGKHVTEQPFFLSRTKLSPSQYSLITVAPFIERLGVTDREYEEEGVFLLRSVMMNPWYQEAKRKGRYFISELVDALYHAASEVFDQA
jgi:glutamate/tyrosine decarboxylase-like PLP-dependent enzyme